MCYNNILLQLKNYRLSSRSNSGKGAVGRETKIFPPKHFESFIVLLLGKENSLSKFHNVLHTGNMEIQLEGKSFEFNDESNHKNIKNKN